MLKGIIFDMDGTITLTEPLHHRALAKVFREYGIDYGLEMHVSRFAGSGSLNTFTKVFAEHGVKVSEEEIKECISKKHNLYTKFVHEEEIPVVPGAKEFIKKIDKMGLERIIATGNSDLDAVRFILGRLGLAGYFPQILSIKEVVRGKPFPDVFTEAAHRLNLSPAECIILEDSVNGVQAASSAGIRCIAFDTTTKKEDLLAAGAFAVVKNYFEITDDLINFYEKKF